MAKTSKPKKLAKQNHKISNQNKIPKQNLANTSLPKPEKPASWAVVRSLFTCKHLQAQQQQQQKQPQNQGNEKSKQQQPQPQQKQEQANEENKKHKKMNCSGSSLCSNTKVMHRPETSSSTSPENMKKRAAAAMNMDGSSSSRSLKTPLKEFNGSTSSSLSSPLRGIPFRKLSGCYECRMVVDPVLGFTRDPSLRATICSCPECGEIFMKPENLELHQTVRHAVSELGPEDTSKNIVEIIFQSSWLRKQQSPVCKIDRILKIQNTPKTISKFEEYRDSIKTKATKLPKKHPRCIADGNELLRFHCTTFMCSLGLNGSSNLCNNIPHCGVCSIIKNGFKFAANGILTTATSGKAHDDSGVGPEDEKRAMLVCRVIAGRVKKGEEGVSEDYDSVAGAAGLYANFDELHVFNAKAILPCFVVIYGGF
ncbi:uncharacterized protein LOC141720336 [Apium graveolens]|uniref:uncharacterized protein LOC141720336 n=1 Tax=Apium graveolens TaxID=4045 RepID=UPI003D7915D0